MRLFLLSILGIVFLTVIISLAFYSYHFYQEKSYFVDFEDNRIKENQILGQEFNLAAKMNKQKKSQKKSKSVKKSSRPSKTFSKRRPRKSASVSGATISDQMPFVLTGSNAMAAKTNLDNGPKPVNSKTKKRRQTLDPTYFDKKLNITQDFMEEQKHSCKVNNTLDFQVDIDIEDLEFNQNEDYNEPEDNNSNSGTEEDLDEFDAAMMEMEKFEQDLEEDENVVLDFELSE